MLLWIALQVETPKKPQFLNMKITGRWGNFFYHNWSCCFFGSLSKNLHPALVEKFKAHWLLSKWSSNRQPSSTKQTCISCTTSHLLAASSRICHAHPNSSKPPDPIFTCICIPFSHLPPTSPTNFLSSTPKWSPSRLVSHHLLLFDPPPNEIAHGVRQKTALNESLPWLFDQKLGHPPRPPWLTR